MPRLGLFVLFLLSLLTAGCAVSGGVGTASVTAQGDEVTVRSSQWGGTVACGPGAPGAPPCAAASVREPAW
jgi:hypothetical protein